MELPISIKQNGIFTFNLEIPYYNWLYPLQYNEDISHQKLHHNDISLNDVKGAYIHIPFCSSLCSFCPYIRTHIHDTELRNKYVHYLIKEIKSYQRNTKPELECVFFGGGSPSLLSPNNFADIMNALHSVFNISTNCEITIEANAMTLNPQLCSTFKTFNVSKVRIGVQSFSSQSRKLYQLKATVSDIVRSTELLKKNDIQVSFDLLFGHHGQSLESFIKDIEMADELNPDTIEIYPLNFLSVPNRYWNELSSTKLHRLSASDRICYFKAGRERLFELGYHQWSGHGFARNESFDLLYHRCVYGTYGGLVSFGPSAISFNNDYIKWNHSDINKYIEDMSKTSMPTFYSRRITELEHKTKKFITELPYYGYIDFSNNDIVDEIAVQLNKLIDSGVINQSDSKLTLSDTAKLQYSSIMFYLLPKDDKEALSNEIFSACARLGNNFTADMIWI